MKKSKKDSGAYNRAFGCFRMHRGRFGFSVCRHKTGEVDRQVSDTVGELLEGIFDGRTIEVEDPERQEVDLKTKRQRHRGRRRRC